MVESYGITRAMNASWRGIANVTVSQDTGSSASQRGGERNSYHSITMKGAAAQPESHDAQIKRQKMQQLFK